MKVYLTKKNGIDFNFKNTKAKKIKSIIVGAILKKSKHEEIFYLAVNFTDYCKFCMQ